MDAPTRRLLFWLKVPYAADIALVLIGVGLLLSSRPVGWWVLLFAAVRAAIGTIALFWIGRRMIARARDDDASGDRDDASESRDD
jgi:membrane protein DedA with SNARE-associated domain